MKMEPTVSSETSAIRTQTPRNYPKRNKLQLEHGERLKTRMTQIRTYEKSWNYFCFKTGLGKRGDGFSVVDAVQIYGLMDPTLQYWQGHTAFLYFSVPRQSFGLGSLPKGKVVEVCS